MPFDGVQSQEEPRTNLLIGEALSDKL